MYILKRGISLRNLEEKKIPFLNICAIIGIDNLGAIYILERIFPRKLEENEFVYEYLKIKNLS